MYNTGKRVSINRVIEKAYRDYGFNTEVVWSDVVEWIADAILLLGVEPAYEDKIKKITITSGKGELPCDVVNIKAVRDFNDLTPLIRSFDQYHLSNQFRCSDEQVADDTCDDSTPTYICNDNFIFTTISDGAVELSYKAMATDENGLPTIPDNEKYIRAMATYVAERIATKLFYQDKFTENKLHRIERDRDWAFSSAKMNMIIPDKDKMESIKNQMLRLVPAIQQHSRGFKYSAHESKQNTKNSY